VPPKPFRLRLSNVTNERAYSIRLDRRQSLRRRESPTVFPRLRRLRWLVGRASASRSIPTSTARRTRSYSQSIRSSSLSGDLSPELSEEADEGKVNVIEVAVQGLTSGHCLTSRTCRHARRERVSTDGGEGHPVVAESPIGLPVCGVAGRCDDQSAARTPVSDHHDSVIRLHRYSRDDGGRDKRPTVSTESRVQPSVWIEAEEQVSGVREAASKGSAPGLGRGDDDPAR
jgi:hypothetical protein